MKRRLALAAAVILCTTSLTQPSELTERIARSTAMTADLRQLCDHIGGRVSGSPASARAVQWAANKFREAGADSVQLEPYKLPAYWRSRVATASCISPAEFAVRIAASPLSASTPEGQMIEGALVDFGDASPQALAKIGNAKGKIAFVRSNVMKSIDDLFGEYMRTTPIMDAARKIGARAILLESSQPRSLLYRHPMSLDGTIDPIPVAIVAHDHADRLGRLLEQGEVRVQLRLDNEIVRNVTENNVVAEIRGSELPDEVVLIGAHLDSWDLGTGAQDNGVNVASIIDILRQMKAAGAKPRRTIRFVLFTGEEQGMIGSKEYVRAHMREMQSVALMMTLDIGSGRMSGFFLNGREDLRGEVEQALLPFYDPKAQQNITDAIDGTDNFDFILAGVPNLVGNQDTAPYLPDYHAESDTFDKVDQKQAKANEAMAAAVLWHFANSPAKLRQQTRSEVSRLLEATHLVEQMKGFEQWEDWISGKRGVRQ